MNIQIPAPPLRLIRRLNEAGFEAYVVGGCVRDAILGRVPHDWDICTNALPEQMQAIFAGERLIETGLKHGTLTVMADGEGYEITTFRTDGVYSDHRHPDKVTFVSDLRADLSRRDFTINAMAYHPDTGVMDFFNGQQDLSDGLIRCVGRAEERFEEDGLRMLRAIRFAARYGFRVEEETAQAIHEKKYLLDHIAAERIFSELKGFLVGQGVCALLLEYRDLLAQVLPQLTPMFDFEQRNPHHCYDVWSHTAHSVEAAPPEIAVRLAMLFHDSGKPACHSRDENGIDHFYQHATVSEQLATQALAFLRCDNHLRDQVLHLVKWHDYILPRTEKAGRRFLRQIGREEAFLNLEVHRADALAQAPETQPEKLAWVEESRQILEKLLAEEACFTLKDLAIGGKDLIALGWKPSPAMGDELERLLSLVVDGEVPNEREALLAQLCKQA